MKLWEKYTKEEIEIFFKNSSNPQEFMEKLGYKNGKSAYRDIRKKYPWITYKYKRLEGKRFGKLVAIERVSTESKMGKHALWKCKCDCGNYVDVESSHLLNGTRTKCPDCSAIDRKMDLIGETFGRITVIDRDIERSQKEGRSYFFGKCSCGNPEIKSYLGKNLLKGNTISCGCYAKSKGEEKIKSILQKLKIDYSSQFRFQDCKDSHTLPFDFYLSDYNILIEYQGIQHYEKQNYFGEKSFNDCLRHDNIKRQYCKEHNYKLIEIPYWDYAILDEEYIKKILENYKREEENGRTDN